MVAEALPDLVGNLTVADDTHPRSAVLRLPGDTHDVGFLGDGEYMRSPEAHGRNVTRVASGVDRLVAAWDNVGPVVTYSHYADGGAGGERSVTYEAGFVALSGGASSTHADAESTCANSGSPLLPADGHIASTGATRVSMSIADLATGQYYALCVRSLDASSNAVATAASVPFVIDGSAPEVDGDVTLEVVGPAGGNPDHASLVNVSWPAFTVSGDANDDVTYLWSLGTTKRGGQLVSLSDEFTEASQHVVGRLQSVVLPVGSDLFATIFATNAAGVMAAHSSPPVHVDWTAPYVYDVAAIAMPASGSVSTRDEAFEADPLLLLSDTGAFAVRWEVADIESAVVNASVCVRWVDSTAGECLGDGPFTVTGAAAAAQFWISVPAGALGLDEGAPGVVFIDVDVANEAGLSASASRRYAIDSTAPTAGVVTVAPIGAAVAGNGPPAGLAHGAQTAFRADPVATVSWVGFVDDESDIASYEWTVVPGAAIAGDAQYCDPEPDGAGDASGVLNWTSSGLAQFALFDVRGFVGASELEDPSLAADGLVVCIRAVNNANKRSTAALSAAAHFDLTPPVRDDAAAPVLSLVVPRADVSDDAELELQVTWEPSTLSDAQSGIAANGYQVSLGTTPFGAQVVDLVAAQTPTRHVFTDTTLSALADGSVLYATVVGTNAAGQASDAVSEGLPIVWTAPAIASLAITVDGAAVRGGYTSRAGVMGVAWEVVDPHVGVPNGNGTIDVRVTATPAEDGPPTVVLEETAAPLAAAFNFSLDPGTLVNGSAWPDGTTIEATLKAVGAWPIANTSTSVISAMLDASAPDVSSAAASLAGAVAGGVALGDVVGDGPFFEGFAGGAVPIVGSAERSRVRVVFGGFGDEHSGVGSYIVSLHAGNATSLDRDAPASAVLAPDSAPVSVWLPQTVVAPRTVTAAAASMTVVLDVPGGLQSGAAYRARVTAVKRSGPTASVWSDVLSVDWTPPQPPTAVGDRIRLNVTRGVDGHAVASVAWPAFSDTESGISGYSIAIGTVAGGTQLLDWTDTASNSPVVEDLRLSRVAYGTPLYAQIAASNGVGAVSWAVMSDANAADALFDATPPALVKYSVPRFALDRERLQAAWQFDDAESGVTRHTLCVVGAELYGGVDAIDRVQGRSVDGCWCDGVNASLPAAKRGASRVGSDTRAALSGLDLADGETYAFVVCAKNLAGLESHAVAATTVDSTEPVLRTEGSVEARPHDLRRNHVGGRYDYTRDLLGLSLEWGSLKDPESGVASIEWAVGLTEGGTELSPFTAVGLARGVRFSAEDYTQEGILSDNTTYHVTVRVANGAGKLARFNAPPVTTDSTPATPGSVWLSNLTNAAGYQTTDTLLCVHWDGFNDNVSGIVDFEVAFGTTPLGEQVVPFTSVGNEARSHCASASLVNGEAFYGTVRAINGAGAVTAAVSDVMKVDVTPPAPPHVFILPLNASLLQSTVSQLTRAQPAYVADPEDFRIRWTPLRDSESAVVQVRCGLGFRAGSFDIAETTVNNPTDSGECGIFKRQQLLVNGAQLFASVEATNAAGLTSERSTSHPIVLDSSPPVATGGVFTGDRRAKQLCLFSNSTLEVWWDEFADTQSGVAFYEWAVSSTPPPLAAAAAAAAAGDVDDAAFEPDILPFSDTGLQTEAVAQNLSMSVGGSVYVAVRATNRAGLRSVPRASVGMRVVCSEADTACHSGSFRCVDGSGRQASNVEVRVDDSQVRELHEVGRHVQAVPRAGTVPVRNASRGVAVAIAQASNGAPRRTLLEDESAAKRQRRAEVATDAADCPTQKAVEVGDDRAVEAMEQQPACSSVVAAGRTLLASFEAHNGAVLEYAEAFAPVNSGTALRDKVGIVLLRCLAGAVHSHGAAAVASLGLEYPAEYVSNEALRPWLLAAYTTGGCDDIAPVCSLNAVAPDPRVAADDAVAISYALVTRFQVPGVDAVNAATVFCLRFPARRPDRVNPQLGCRVHMDILTDADKAVLYTDRDQAAEVFYDIAFTPVQCYPAEQCGAAGSKRNRPGSRRRLGAAAPSFVDVAAGVSELPAGHDDFGVPTTNSRGSRAVVRHGQRPPWHRMSVRAVRAPQAMSVMQSATRFTTHTDGGSRRLDYTTATPRVAVPAVLDKNAVPPKVPKDATLQDPTHLIARIAAVIKNVAQARDDGIATPLVGMDNWIGQELGNAVGNGEGSILHRAVYYADIGHTFKERIGLYARAFDEVQALQPGPAQAYYTQQRDGLVNAANVILNDANNAAAADPMNAAKANKAAAALTMRDNVAHAGAYLVGLAQQTDAWAAEHASLAARHLAASAASHSASAWAAVAAEAAHGVMHLQVEGAGAATQPQNVGVPVAACIRAASTAQYHAVQARTHGGTAAQHSANGAAEAEAYAAWVWAKRAEVAAGWARAARGDALAGLAAVQANTLVALVASGSVVVADVSSAADTASYRAIDARRGLNEAVAAVARLSAAPAPANAQFAESVADVFEAVASAARASAQAAHSWRTLADTYHLLNDPALASAAAFRAVTFQLFAVDAQAQQPSLVNLLLALVGNNQNDPSYVRATAAVDQTANVVLAAQAEAQAAAALVVPAPDQNAAIAEVANYNTNAQVPTLGAVAATDNSAITWARRTFDAAERAMTFANSGSSYVSAWTAFADTAARCTRAAVAVSAVVELNRDDFPFTNADDLQPAFASAPHWLVPVVRLAGVIRALAYTIAPSQWPRLSAYPDEDEVHQVALVAMADRIIASATQNGVDGSDILGAVDDAVVFNAAVRRLEALALPASARRTFASVLPVIEPPIRNQAIALANAFVAWNGDVPATFAQLMLVVNVVPQHPAAGLADWGEFISDFSIRECFRNPSSNAGNSQRRNWGKRSFDVGAAWPDYEVILSGAGPPNVPLMRKIEIARMYARRNLPGVNSRRPWNIGPMPLPAHLAIVPGGSALQYPIVTGGGRNGGDAIAPWVYQLDDHSRVVLASGPARGTAQNSAHKADQMFTRCLRATEPEYDSHLAWRQNDYHEAGHIRERQAGGDQDVINFVSQPRIVNNGWHKQCDAYAEDKVWKTSQHHAGVPRASIRFLYDATANPYTATANPTGEVFVLWEQTNIAQVVGANPPPPLWQPVVVCAGYYPREDYEPGKQALVRDLSGFMYLAAAPANPVAVPVLEAGQTTGAFPTILAAAHQYRFGAQGKWQSQDCQGLNPGAAARERLPCMMRHYRNHPTPNPDAAVMALAGDRIKELVCASGAAHAQFQNGPWWLNVVSEMWGNSVDPVMAYDRWQAWGESVCRVGVNWQ